MKILLRHYEPSVIAVMVGAGFLATSAVQAERVEGWEWHTGDLQPADVFGAGGRWEQAAPGSHWKMGEGQRGWLRNDLTVPASIGGQSMAGRPVAVDLSTGDGGAIYVDGRLQSRYDNDHPGAALLTARAVPGETHRVAVQVYGPVPGELWAADRGEPPQAVVPGIPAVFVDGAPAGSDHGAG